jgi:hypothetical protein
LNIKALVFLEHLQAVLTCGAFMPTLALVWEKRVELVAIVLYGGWFPPPKE